MTTLEATTFMAEWVSNLEAQKESLQAMIEQGQQFIKDIQEGGIQ